ncbi:hypothetical protein ACX4MT_01970 [Roseomonas mucosa]
MWSALCLKGGVSKTSLVQCLAVEALKEGMRTAIVDLDPQQSCYRWGQARTKKGIPVPAVVTLGGRSLQAVLADLQKQGAAVVLIDTPPVATPEINAALEVSQAAILVSRPNPMDLDALAVTWQIVQRFPKVRSAAILTQAPPGGRAKALGLAMGRLKKMGITTCPMALSYTLSYPYAQAESLTVQEREPSSKPRAELAEVWSWLKRSEVI